MWGLSELKAGGAIIGIHYSVPEERQIGLPAPALSIFRLVPTASGFDVVHNHTMTWIQTIPLSEANESLLRALESQRSPYPKEYAAPVFRSDDETAGIVASHSLIPDALFHSFSTFGVLMSPELPLDRRHHEMITTMVSVTNRCFY